MLFNSKHLSQTCFGKRNTKNSIMNKIFLLLLSLFLLSENAIAQDHPNILLVIADDLGVDHSNGYHEPEVRPITPTLDSLRGIGITFENGIAAPVCSPTRAAIMSGKYGIANGVTQLMVNFDTTNTSIFKELANQTNDAYADAVIGKWHLSARPIDNNHPEKHGIDYFMGPIGGAVQDYFSWNKVENGVTSREETYATTAFTDASIDWIQNQTKPWFLWQGHIAPHTPFHVPPPGMFSIDDTSTDLGQFVAMIESLDFELNRLLNSLSQADRDNTVVIYIGDNGTPNNVLRDYPNQTGKGSLYQGGIRVPFIVAGKGISRKGERETALVHVLDIYATILELAGADLPGGIYNSLSFKHLLAGEAGATRSYNYGELEGNFGTPGYTLRDEQYKIIKFNNGSEEMYDLLNDSLELNNLLLTLTPDLQAIKTDLETEAQTIRTNFWTCRDHIQNGDEEGIDCGGSFCAPCSSSVEETAEGHFKVFPNPSEGLMTIQLNAPAAYETSLKIISLSGKIMHSTKVEKGETVVYFDNSNFANGMYLAQLSIDNQLFTNKFFINK